MSGALATPGVSLPPPPEPPEAPEAVPAPGKRKRPTTRAERAAASAAAADRKAAGPIKADAKPRTTKAPAKRGSKADVINGVAGIHAMAGIVLPLAGMPHTGAALELSGEDAGQAWAEAAERYPIIAKAFGSGQDGLVLFKLLMIYAPLVQTAIAEKSGALAGVPAPAGGVDLGSLLAGLGPLATQPDVPAGQNSNGRP